MLWTAANHTKEAAVFMSEVGKKRHPSSATNIDVRVGQRHCRAKMASFRQSPHPCNSTRPQIEEGKQRQWIDAIYQIIDVPYYYQFIFASEKF